MFKKLKENKKGFTAGRADRCTGNSGYPGSTAGTGTDWVY